jgi:hypothetical protein
MPGEFPGEDDLRSREERLGYEDPEDFAATSEESFERFLEDKSEKSKRFEVSERMVKILKVAKDKELVIDILGDIFNIWDEPLFAKFIITVDKNWMEDPNTTKDELLEKYEHFRNLNKVLYGIGFLSLFVTPMLFMLSPYYPEGFHWGSTGGFATVAILGVMGNIAWIFSVKDAYYKSVINSKLDEEKMRNLKRLEDEYDVSVKRKNIIADNQDEAKRSQGVSEF